MGGGKGGGKDILAVLNGEVYCNVLYGKIVLKKRAHVAFKHCKDLGWCILFILI